MKRTIKRLISSIFIIVVLLLCGNIQKIYGVGILHQAWVQENGTESYVLFRTYTTPHPSSLRKYGGLKKGEKVAGTATADGSFYNTQTKTTQTSYWVYEDQNVSSFDDLPEHGQFQTYELVFYGENTIGTYLTGSTYGYTQMTPSSAAIGKTLQTSLYNSAVSVKTGVKSEATANEGYPTEAEIAYNSSGSWMGSTPEVETDPWFRMTLVAANSNPKGKKPIYVTDRILDTTTISNINDAANEKGLFFTYKGYNKCLRVSNVLTSETYTTAYTYPGTNYDRLATPWSFINQGAGWSKEALGNETAALGSALNLYDNVLVFPDEGARTIIVRHIDIENNEVITTASVESAISSGQVKNYETVPLDQDGMPTDPVGKEKLNNILISDTTSQTDFAEEYMGYNVANAATKEEAEEIIKAKVAASNLDSSTEQYTAPTFSRKQDEVIIVEMYYRSKPRQFNEIHIFYDENGNVVDRTETVHNKDDEDQYVKVGSKKTLYKKDLTGTAYQDYKYLGAVAKTTGEDPAISQYDISKEILTLDYVNDSAAQRYGYFAYQNNTKEISEHHILFIKNEGSTDLVPVQYHTIVGTNTKTLQAKTSSSYQYKGVIANPAYTPSLSDFNSGASMSTTYTATSTDNAIYFGYYQEAADIYVRHILFNADGDYKTTLSQYKVSAADPSTTVDRGAYRHYKNWEDRLESDTDAFYYKGFIKTNTDNLPTLGAYVTEDSCEVKLREVKKGEVYVNFLYKERQKKVKLAQPDIDATGLLDFNTTQKSTDTCVSEVYTSTEKWRKILSVPINTEIEFGIIKQPRYILGALKVKQEERVNDGSDHRLLGGMDERNISKAIAILTTVKAHGISSEGEQVEQVSVVNVHEFIFPWKYSKYELENKKVFKLSQSNVYQPGYTASHGNYKVVGQEMLSDKAVYTAFYNLANIDVDFNDAAKPGLVLKDFEYEFYLDPSLGVNCSDLESDYEKVASCSGMAASTNKTILKSELSGIVNILGVELVKDETVIIQEQVDVYASYDEETGAQGITGMFRYTNNKMPTPDNEVYVHIYNDETTTEKIAEFFEKLKGWIIEIINGIIQLIFKTEDVAIQFQPDELRPILKGLAQNTHYFLNGNDGGLDAAVDGKRDVIFTINLESSTSQTTMTIDGDIIAKNKAPEIKEIKIDSSNFTPTTTRGNNGWSQVTEGFTGLIDDMMLSYNQYLYKFGGYVDFSETGVMTITQKGKEYYTKGFNVVENLLEEAALNLDGTKTSDKNSGENFKDTVSNKKNGLRIFAGDIKYLPSNTDVFEDNIFHSDKATTGTTYVFESKRTSYTEDVNKDEFVTYKEGLLTKKERAVEIVNIYTPMKVIAGTPTQDHHIEPESQLMGPIASSGLTDKIILESGFKFNIGIQAYNGDKYTSIADTKIKEYLKGFYLKFDFHTEKLKVNGRDDYSALKIKVNGGNYSGGSIPANTWVYIPGNLLGTGNTLEVSTRSMKPVTGEASYTVRAVAKNILDLESKSKSSSLASFYESYQNICNDKYPYGASVPIDPLTSEPIKSDDSPVYYDEEVLHINSKSVERLYDFRITDVKDIDWKNVFRKNSTEHNGVSYYVGTRYWKNGYAEAGKRKASEIGTDPTRLLPIGPYKHTNGSYTKAPKLGYRFSFDLKLTGEYDPSKVVIIEPTFYYVSKDGNNYSRVDLYYKNSSDNYVKVGSLQDNYDLTFIPNDGYRLLESGNIHLSNEAVSLWSDVSSYPTVSGTLGESTPLTRLVLRANTMSTSNETGMTFYGEYKLPNSTVAVRNGQSVTNKNNHLSNGYIAVVFDIIYYHDIGNAGSRISYSTGMQKVDGTPMSILKGTSQWEYEGYLGMKYSNTSKKQPEIKLENGNFNFQEINDNKYQQFLGTVVLFDLDARAATDFN